MNIRTFRSYVINTITNIRYGSSIRERVYLGIFALGLFLSLLFLVWLVQINFFTNVSAAGGTYRHAVIGVPRFINPLLAQNDSEREMVRLVYSGLVREISHDVYIPDLAASYTISPDEKTYTFTLKKNLTFHDGKPLTINDVLYTYKQLQKSNLPEYSGWRTVELNTTADTIILKLSQPYGDFLKMTTVGILPAHIWESQSDTSMLASSFNSSPIGSGPYKIESIKTNSAGIPESYTLTAFKKYALGNPYIRTITIITTTSVTEYIKLINNGDLDGGVINGTYENILAMNIPNTLIVENKPSAKVFALFFNTTKNSIDGELRSLLNSTLDRTGLVTTITGGTAYPLYEPLATTTTTLLKPGSTAEIAKLANYFKKNGYQKNTITGIYEKKENGTNREFSITLTLLDHPEFKKIATELKKYYATLGITINLEIFQINDFEHAVLAKRDYQVVLFGYTATRPADLYAYWHSSQKNYPGLNISGYENTELDKQLEYVISHHSTATTDEAYEKIKSILQKNLPAIFIYNPADFIIHKKSLTIPEFPVPLSHNTDYLNTISLWYTKTDAILNIFNRQ